MTPERYARVQEVFTRACGLDRHAAAMLLEAECVDDAELRECVEQLLAFDAAPVDPLRTPALGAGLRTGLNRLASSPIDPSRPSATLAVPSQIGRYRVLDVLGQGGMGVVYRAEQDRPRRIVALKVIGRDLVTPALLRRFEHEAEILGRLHHPGIAQIFEAGAAPSTSADRSPQPYFAMELIAGSSLTEYSRASSLSPNERIELFIRVCEAVQHAHERGVIHRDLKPSNILVDHSTTPAQPKVLDFGVARLHDPAGPATLSIANTSVGQLIGTLPYMSPEQVTGDADEIDTRSDVYALGVVLFELLTDRLPLDLTDRPLPEAARIISEQEPSRLSTIHHALRGDLDTIVGKALSKDKSRRYQSASALADDLRRYLAGDPILARQDSVVYVMRKRIRQFRTGVAVACVLVIGLSLFALQRNAEVGRKQELVDRERDARESAEGARDLARMQKKQADEQRQRADASAEKAKRELEISTIERGRLLGYAGDFPSAERLIWPVYLANPSVHGYWALWELYRRNPCFLALPGARGALSSIRVSSDGKMVVAAGDDARARVWDVASGTLVATLSSDNKALPGIALTRDGNVLSTSVDGSLRVWNIHSSKEVAKWPVAGGQLWHVVMADNPTLPADARAAAPEWALVGCIDGSVRAIDLADGRERQVFALKQRGTPSIAAHADAQGTTVYTGALNGSVDAWDLATGLHMAHLGDHAGGANAMALTHDGRRLVTAGNNRAILLWDLEPREGASVRLSRPPRRTQVSDFIRTLSFSEDGDTLIGATYWATEVWSVSPDGDLMRQATYASQSVSLAMSPDGRWFAAGGGDGVVRLWQTRARQDVRRVAAHRGAATAIAMNADGTRVFSIGRGDGTVTAWDAASLTELARRPITGEHPTCVDVSPDGRQVAVATFERHVELLDASTLEPVATVISTGAEIGAVRYSPDGRTLAVSEIYGTVHLIDVASGNAIRSLTRAAGLLPGITFADGGQSILGAFSADPIVAWNLATGSQSGESPRRIGPGPRGWSIAAFSGRPLAVVGGWNGEIEIWNIETARRVRDLRGHTRRVRALAVGPVLEDGGTMFASCSLDGVIKLWSSASDLCLATLQADIQLAEEAARVDPPTTETASGPSDQSAAAGPLESVSGPTCVQLSNDGRWLYSAHAHGLIAAWDLHQHRRHIQGNRRLQEQVAQTPEPPSQTPPAAVP